MECWIPLFDIFLNSPCPESEASLWLKKSFNPLSNSTPISTSSFLALLAKPSPSVCSSPTQDRGVMWIQTLPDFVQSRILSFLAYDYERFCMRDLCKIARVILGEGKHLDFWVKKGAEKLLDLVSVSNYRWLSHLNLDSEEEHLEHEFLSLPDWLRDIANDREPMLNWLPVRSDELGLEMLDAGCEHNNFELSVSVEGEMEQRDSELAVEEIHVEKMKFDDPLDPDDEMLAKSMKEQLLSTESAYKAVDLGNKIFEFCVKNKGKLLAFLQMIELWKVDDETASVLVCKSSYVSSDGLDLPDHILCSVLLPKFLVLSEPSSHLLMSATVEYCKAHQKSAECALILPLMLRSEGVNNPLCDLLTRVLKECLHPAHVSAIFEKLLCRHEAAHEIICLPCHRDLISDELAWTESLFTLLQNILNLNVHLTQDSVNQLVGRVCEFGGERYSKSLKFGNFLLCLVNKCSLFLRPHKLLLTATVENTNSLVTKSILSKLSSL